MGRIFDAMQRSTETQDTASCRPLHFAAAAEMLDNMEAEAELSGARPMAVQPGPRQRLVSLAAQRTLGAEKIRILAARLKHIQEQRHIKRLLITSTIKDEGKTVLSANLAISFAKMKQRVLLVDGDCHQSGAGRLLGSNGAPGLSDWYHADAPIENFLRKVEGLPLWFLPAGTPLEQPVEMLQSEKGSMLLTHLHSWFDWIIIDSPPSAPLVDSAVWAKLAEGILLVVRDGRTPKRLLKKVVASLDSGKLLGLVLNDCSDPDQQYYWNYYHLDKNA